MNGKLGTQDCIFQCSMHTLKVVLIAYLIIIITIIILLKCDSHIFSSSLSSSNTNCSSKMLLILQQLGIARQLHLLEMKTVQENGSIQLTGSECTHSYLQWFKYLLSCALLPTSLKTHLTCQLLSLQNGFPAC